MKRLLVLALCLGPGVLLAQRKEDLQSIQRDIAQMGEQIKQLQHSQDEKMAALQSMIQQAVDASNKMAQGLAAFEKDVSSKLNDQQNKLVAPVVTLGSKVDQMSDDFRSVATNVTDLVRRMGALDSKLADISSAIRTLSIPAPQPAQAAGPGSPPPGISAETSFQNAFRDYMGGKDDLAMQEFNDYLKWFAQTENGPGAEYYIGMLYSKVKQYDEAVKAFDAVLERWPENPRTPEAMYYKAFSLMQGGHKTEAGKVFKEFIQRYPRNDHVTAAHQNLKSLGLDSRPTGGKKRE